MIQVLIFSSQLLMQRPANTSMTLSRSNWVMPSTKNMAPNQPNFLLILINFWWVCRLRQHLPPMTLKPHWFSLTTAVNQRLQLLRRIWKGLILQLWFRSHHQLWSSAQAINQSLIKINLSFYFRRFQLMVRLTQCLHLMSLSISMVITTLIRRLGKQFLRCTSSQELRISLHALRV